MTFAQRLAGTAALVDERLAELLGPSAAGTPPDRLHAAMRYALLGGAKRFRPFLLIESARLFGVKAEDVLDVAAALECVHCYSLAHDDLPAMDDDDLRRGRPTLHKAFDEWTAILAGDVLLTLGFEILARPETCSDPALRSEVILALAKAAGGTGMAGGQALDLEADKLGRPSQLDEAHVLRLQAMKTGALIEFACEAGAILGRAADEDRLAMKRYGAALGLAFQIADDLLDAEGEASVVGKAVAKDASAGKATLVALLGIEETRAHLAEIQDEAVGAIARFGDRASILRDAIAFVSERRR